MRRAKSKRGVAKYVMTVCLLRFLYYFDQVTETIVLSSATQIKSRMQFRWKI